MMLRHAREGIAGPHQRRQGRQTIAHGVDPNAFGEGSGDYFGEDQRGDPAPTRRRGGSSGAWPNGIPSEW
jgi:hypothetical protein